MGARLRIGNLFCVVTQRMNNVLLGHNQARAGFIALACLITIMGLALYPYTRSGFFFDDIYNSELNGVLAVLHLSLAQFISKMLDLWVVQTGRFFPTSIAIVYTFWTFAEDLQIYRILQLGLVIIDIGLFWLLLRKISGSLHLASLAAFFLPILLQFNPNLDGVTSFGPLNQGVLLFVLLSWLLTYRYVTSDKVLPLSLGLAAVFEMGALTFYEVGVLVIPGLIGISFYAAASAKRRYLSMAVTLCTAFIFFALYVWFSLHKAAAYPGSEIGSLQLIPRTFVAQFFSAFPLALLKNSGVSMFISGHFIGLLIGWLVVFTVAIVFFSQNLHFIGRDSTKIDSKNKLLFIIIFSLAVVPAAILSLSKYHQEVQSYGNPQSVVFIQIFGVALFFSLATTWLMASVKSGTKKTTLILIFSVSYALIFTMTSSLNFRRILDMNEVYLKPRQKMEQMLHMGLLDDLPENNLLMIEDTFPWESGGLIFSNLGACSGFFTHHAGRIVHCQTADSIIKGGVQLPDVAGHLFLMKRDGDLGRVVVNNETMRTLAVQSPSEKPGTYTLAREKGSFSMSLMPVTEGGVRAWEGVPSNRFAWAGTKGKIKFTNVSTNSNFIKSNVVLLSPNARTVHVIANGAERIIRLFPDKPQPVDIELTNLRFGESGIVSFESKEPGGIIAPTDLEIKYQIQYVHTN